MKRFLSLLALLLIVTVLPLSALASGEGELENPYIRDWAKAYAALYLNMMGSDTVLANSVLSDGKIPYAYEGNVRSNGVEGQDVADGGQMSDGGTVSLGLGAGVTDESLWYVTLMFNEGTDGIVALNETRIVFMALQVAELLPKDLEDDDIYTLIDVLLNWEEDYAMELNGVVLAKKTLDDGSYIVMADSVNFYNAYDSDSYDNNHYIPLAE